MKEPMISWILPLKMLKEMNDVAIHIKIYKIKPSLLLLFLLILLILATIFFYSNVFAREPEGIKVPIIMYHSILKDSSKHGKYVLSPEQLEQDFQYIQEKGFTTITFTDLISYVYNRTSLPEKPIIITFDDGHYNNYVYAVPLLQQYHMKAVISIVGSYTETYSKSGETNPNYTYLRWQDIKELSQGEIIEFANHSYHLHSNTGRKGCMKKIGESLDDYHQILTSDLMKLQENFLLHTNTQPSTFTYPFGLISNESLDIIKELGFQASLSCKTGVNYITFEPECLYLLKRNNRPSGISTENFFKNFD